MDEPLPPPLDPDLYPPPSRAARTPGSIKVIGILDLLFAALSAIGAVQSAAFVLAPQGADEENPVLEIIRESEGFLLFAQVSVVTGFLVAALYFAAGVGLLQKRPWSRPLNTGISLYQLAAVAVGLVITWTCLAQPLLEEASGMPDGPEKYGMIGGAIGGMLGAAVGMVYPAVVLWFMTRPRVRAALSRGPSGP